MPRHGAITFRDIAGKLDATTVQCDKCGRFRRYHVDRLIERHGIDAKLFDCQQKPIARSRWRGMSTTRAAQGSRTCRRWSEAPLHHVSAGSRK